MGPCLGAALRPPKPSTPKKRQWDVSRREDVSSLKCFMTVAQLVFRSPPRCDMTSAYQNFCPQWCETMLAGTAVVLHWSKRHKEGFPYQRTCLCPPAVTVCLFKNPPLPAKPARQELLLVEGSKFGRSLCSWRGERLCPP